MLRPLPNIEGFNGIPGPEAYQIRNEYAQHQLPKPKEIKARLPFIDVLVLRSFDTIQFTSY